MSSVTTFLLSLLVCCALLVSVLSCGSGETNQATNKKDVVLFKSSQQYDNLIGESDPDGGSDSSITLDDFYSPFLLSTEDEVVALTGANCSKNCDNKINVLTMYIKTEEVVQFFTTSVGGIGSEWNKQIALKQVAQNKKDTLKFILAAAKGKNIHILLVNESSNEAAEAPEDALKWDCSFFTGNFNNGKLAKAQIKWNGEILPGGKKIDELKNEFKSKKPPNGIPSNGFVLLTEAKKIFFVIQFDSENNTKIFTFLQLKDDTTTINFAELIVADGCTFNLFTWQEKIMLAKYCTQSSSMYELQGDETTWKQTNEPISRLLPYLKDKNNFTAAKIDNLSVLLFTQEKEITKNSAGETHCIDLWITDGIRLYDVGCIVTSKNKIIFAGLLHTKEKLFSLHKKSEDFKNIVFTQHHNKLKEISATLEQWKRSNEKIQQLYKNTATGENPCSADGLVGYLSGTITDDNKKWMNGYINADHVIYKKQADKLKNENSFKFNEDGGGAKWEVSRKDKEQPYNFKEFGFTLVATVTVGSSTNRKENSVLGVVLTGTLKSVGLWCTTNGKWVLSGVDDQAQIQPSSVDCTPDKIYYVAVILNKSKEVSVYVNGEKLSKLQSKAIKITISENINHFYFGAESDKATDVTITNVLLYNRPFTGEEAEKLKPKQNEADSQAIPQGNGSTLLPKKESTEQIDNSSDTSAEQIATKNNEKEHSSSPPQPPPSTTTEDSAVRVGVVGVLCFMLFGVFTLLGRYGY